MNKITKLLSVFIIAGAIGTGVAGVAGCNKGGDDSGNGGGGTQHTHHYADTSATSNNNGTHTLTCDADGDCDAKTKIEDCKDTDSDNHCDKCDATMADPSKVAEVTITCAKTIKIGTTVELTATVTPDTATDKTVTWTITKGGEYAEIVKEGEKSVLKLKDGVVGGEEITVKASAGGKDATEVITVAGLTRFDILSKSDKNVISDDFQGTFADNKLPDYTGYENTTAGLYGWGDGKAYEAEGCYVKVESGKATHVTAGGKNSSIVADLGAAVTGDKVIEGYVEFSATKFGNNWAVMAITGKTDIVTATAEVFSIVSADSNGTIGYRTGGKDTAATNVVPTTIKFAVGTVYEVDYKLDLSSGLIDVTITPQGGTAIKLCEGVQTNITEVKTVTFVSSNKGERLTSIDNIAINVSELSVDELKASLSKKLDAYVAIATVDTPNAGEDTLTLTGEGVTTAVNTVKSAIEAATTAEAAKQAYVLTAVDAAILAQAQTSAKTILTDFRSDESFTHVGSNKDAMETAKANGATAIEAATDVADVRAALKAAKEVCAAVLNDTDDNATKVDITLKLGNDEGASVGTISQAVSGQEISVADLIKAITSDLFLKKVTIYEDAEHNTPITEGYTPSADNTSVTLYVVIEDKVNTGTYTFTVGGVKADGTLAPAYTQTGTEDIKAEELLDVDSSKWSTFDSNDFKLGSGNNLTFKIDVKAGQTITINITGRSASKSADKTEVVATHVTCSATGAGITDAAVDREFATDSATAVEAITYTATADGTVTFTIARKDGTNKLSEIAITVADAAQA